jgi:hypothetical protein
VRQAPIIAECGLNFSLPDGGDVQETRVLRFTVIDSSAAGAHRVREYIDKCGAYSRTTFSRTVKIPVIPAQAGIQSLAGHLSMIKM